MRALGAQHHQIDAYRGDHKAGKPQPQPPCTDRFHATPPMRPKPGAGARLRVDTVASTWPRDLALPLRGRIRSGSRRQGLARRDAVDTATGCLTDRSFTLVLTIRRIGSYSP